MEGRMEAKLDRFGRIVIPRKLRGLLGLKPGSSLKILGEEGRLVLMPAAPQQLLEAEDGLLVFVGDADGDLEQTLSDVRNDGLSRCISEWTS
jgi:AbrB family looped-hinge helix DNA binding protein